MEAEDLEMINLAIEAGMPELAEKIRKSAQRTDPFSLQECELAIAKIDLIIEQFECLEAFEPTIDPNVAEAWRLWWLDAAKGSKLMFQDRIKELRVN